MRKYFLSILAICLAIGFSAFTTPKKNRAVTEEKYYWYEIVNGVTVSDTPINPSTKKTRTEILPSAGQCTDDDGELCLAGYEDFVNEDTAAPVEQTDNLLFDNN
jgi:hypothetical protein